VIVSIQFRETRLYLQSLLEMDSENLHKLLRFFSTIFSAYFISPEHWSINKVVFLIIKANRMHCFSTLFGKELCMFQTDLLSIIRSLNTVFTAIGICHTSYVDCLLVRC